MGRTNSGLKPHRSTDCPPSTGRCAPAPTAVLHTDHRRRNSDADDDRVGAGRGKARITTQSWVLSARAAGPRVSTVRTSTGTSNTSRNSLSKAPVHLDRGLLAARGQRHRRLPGSLQALQVIRAWSSTWRVLPTRIWIPPRRSPASVFCHTPSAAGGQENLMSRSTCWAEHRRRSRSHTTPHELIHSSRTQETAESPCRNA